MNANQREMLMNGIIPVIKKIISSYEETEGYLLHDALRTIRIVIDDFFEGYSEGHSCDTCFYYDKDYKERCKTCERCAHSFWVSGEKQ